MSTIYLTYLASAALAAGEIEKAQNYARKLLKITDKFESSKWTKRSVSSFTGSATHTGNMVLGLIALESDDIEKAKEHLLAAGHVIGNPPTLTSFGPDMLLAKKLIEKGERETVVQYFDLCANFWKRENAKLEKWKNVVEQGGIPDFGANLIYVTNDWRYAQKLLN